VLNEVKYEYGLNRRVKKVTASETRGFWYSNQWQCVEERVGDFSLMQARYFWGLRYVDDLIFRERDMKAEPNGSINERWYAVADPNWNIVAMGGKAGAPQERFAYNAFGNPIRLNASFGIKSTALYTDRYFTGQILDTETGLMLYRNRVYHPTLGRFLQRDPIGYSAGDVNLVRYVSNGPQVRWDTFGLDELQSQCEDMCMYDCIDTHEWFLNRPYNKRGDLLTLLFTFICKNHCSNKCNCDPDYRFPKYEIQDKVIMEREQQKFEIWTQRLKDQGLWVEPRPKQPVPSYPPLPATPTPSSDGCPQGCTNV
jgi:RHS repeat-associated protein